jgi:hypothetical protein
MLGLPNQSRMSAFAAKRLMVRPRRAYPYFTMHVGESAFWLWLRPSPLAIRGGFPQ